MENASKALIIAGAILLSILIIAIGVFIFNSAAETIRGANLNPQEIQQYNEPFEQYGGDNVSGSMAMSLCDAVRNHNLGNSSDVSKQIQVITGTAADPTPAPTTAVTAASVNNVKKTLRSGYTYKVTFGYDSETGYVTQIGIQQN